MGRTYKVTFPAVAVTAASDLLQIKGATGKTLQVMRVRWKNTDNTLATAQMLQTRARFLPATVTDGTGGSTATPQPLDPGDAAASFTVKTNNTTKATTGGTPSILHEGAEHIYSGEDITDTAGWPTIGPSESYVFELTSAAIQGTVHLSVTAWVKEVGG